MTLPSQPVEAFLLKVSQLKPDWEYKPSPSKWSNKEVIGHLIDSAQTNLNRFVRCTYEENFKLVYYQDEYVAAQRYQSADINELLTLWMLLNAQITRVLADYPTDRRNVTCDTGKDSVSFHTVEWLATDYLAHMQHHLDHIIQTCLKTEMN
ncbi:MAG: DinB family protein [Bacteroidota bacterium]